MVLREMKCKNDWLGLLECGPIPMGSVNEYN